jgi:hypothetical protein
MKRIHILSSSISVSNSIFPILILKSVRTTVEERAVKDVFPVDEIAEAFKATVPLVVAESFVHALPLITSKAKIEIFSCLIF